MTIKKGDVVQITVGKDRSKTGKVLRVMRDEKKAVVEGLNVVKKHVRPKKQGEKGEIINVPRPLDISNIRIMCGHCEKSVRMKTKLENKVKTRVCAQCGREI